MLMVMMIIKKGDHNNNVDEEDAQDHDARNNNDDENDERVVLACFFQLRFRYIYEYGLFSILKIGFYNRKMHVHFPSWLWSICSS